MLEPLPNATAAPPRRAWKPRPPPRPRRFLGAPAPRLVLPGRARQLCPSGPASPRSNPSFRGKEASPTPLASPGLTPLPHFSHPAVGREELSGGRVFPTRAPFNNRPTTETPRQQLRTPPRSPQARSRGRQRFLRHVSPPQAAARPRCAAAPAPPPHGSPGAPAPRILRPVAAGGHEPS